MTTAPADGSVTIRLDRDARAELDALARTRGRDPAVIAAEAVAAYLDLQRWQAEEIRRRMLAGPEQLASDEEVEAAYAAFR
jgi:predicted transcriptional regulator